MTFRIAFYRGKGNCMDGMIRFWDNGPYSHVELVFSNGYFASASYQDGKRVRKRRIAYNPDNWDFIELPAYLEEKAWAYFLSTEGLPYDLWGQIRFFIMPLEGDETAFWCSEWCAAALGMDEPFRYGPNSLRAALSLLSILQGK